MANSIETLGTTYETYPFVHNFRESIPQQVYPSFDKVKFNDTSYSLIENYESSPIVFTVSNTFMAREELHSFLTFIEDHRGRKTCFWYYMKTTNFIIMEDVSLGASQITCDLNFYGAYYRTFHRIWFELTNGDIYVRRVTDASDSQANLRTIVYVTPTIESAIDASEVVICGRVLLCRFDIDEFWVKHLTNEKAEVSIRLLERPVEYPAT